VIPKELAKKIRYIQIYSSKIVNEMLAGEYHSVFKGRGMEFDEVREYQPGDETRMIDWNVTARSGRPYVKRYVEERELTLFFLIDLSASGTFGSAEKTKNEVAAEICALLAFSAIKNNDKVGLIVFTDQIELFVPPKKGSSHVLRIIRDLLCFTPSRSRTNIALGLEHLGRLTEKRAVVFLISDFQASEYEEAMRVVGRRHDLIAIAVSDRRERLMPRVGLIELQDAETGRTRVIDTDRAALRRRFDRAAQARQRRLRESLSAMRVDLIEILTHGDYVRELVRFFRTRERRQAGEAAR
jgi:uncharacterized protein (DUF58 family)